ncbi:MAG: HD domain-containing protein [Minisyncoccia bacterium]
MRKDYVEEARREAEEAMGMQPDQSVAHRMDHIIRVWKWTKFISQKLIKDGEKINMEELEIAVLLHDIRQLKNEEKSLHVSRSVEKSEEILRKIGYPEDKIKNVLKIISQHSSEDIKAPETIEAKILYDADKLDGFGATGIARVFTLCGQQGMAVEEAVEWYKRKIAKAKPFMQTEIAKAIVGEGEKFVNIFFEKFKEEQEFLKAV